MEHIKITGLPFDASRIGLGTWAIGGWLWGGTEESDAISTIHAALDNGINLIDTAPVYGFGRSEELVGKALQGGRRADAIIATKVGLDWGSGKILRNSTPARLRQELEDSLRRLKTDVIDIYQVHWPDASVPFEERRQERSRPFAARERSAPSASAIFRRSRWTASGRGRRSPPSSRPTICSSVRSKRTCFLTPSSNGLVVLAYGALCRGLLTGKITAKTEFKGDDLRKTDPKFRQPRLGQYLAAVERLDRFARERYGKTVLALAVRWLLDRGKIVALWGARRPDQLAPVADVMGWTLDAAAMQEIDRILAETINGRRRSGIHGAAAVTAGRTEQAEAG